MLPRVFYLTILIILILLKYGANVKKRYIAAERTNNP